MKLEEMLPALVQDDRPVSPKDDDFLLRSLVEGTAATTGVEFFRALVRNLALHVPAELVFIIEFANQGKNARTMALWTDNTLQPTIEFQVSGTSWEELTQAVYRVSPQLFSSAGSLLSRNHHLLGEPMRDEDGRVIGFVVIGGAGAVVTAPRFRSIFQLFAERAGVELDRLRVEDALRESEQCLARILGSTMDAILTVDETLHITLFNEAAEKVFQITASEALGKPVDFFLSENFSRFFHEYVTVLCREDHSRQRIWLPEGLTAMRLNGESFAIEGSISYVKVAGREFFTVILHDIGERQKTETEIRKLQEENRYLQEELKAEYNFEEIIGTTPVMQKVFQKVKQVAGVDSTVLIIGETGTGKELIARAIHNRSKRHNRPLIKVNCAALSHGLIESEFFGHEKGAFTGAITQRVGRFELAHGGTIFLDEVGEISLEVQSKLLRVLQEQEFERVGGSKTIAVDVRVIAATNRDLKKAVEEGRFRADLYYRLNVFPLNLPPLRERKEDISLLVRYFVSKHMARIGKKFTHIPTQVIESLTAYPWWGNIRELENVVERAVVLCDGPFFDLEEEPGGLFARAHSTESALPPTPKAESGLKSLEEIERNHILQVLAEANWVIDGPKGAASILKLKPNTLRSRLQKLNLRRPGNQHPS